MKLIQRLGYYLGGFSVGLIILAFFLNGKKVSCDYGPDARVLKNISTKKIVFSDSINLALSENKIDSLSISYLLKTGDVNFSKSYPREIPCPIYFIEGQFNNLDLTLKVQNCDSIATLVNIFTSK